MSNQLSEEKQDGATTIDAAGNNRQRKQPGVARDYKCPCGKTYLSYPALFTHIKQKHGGQVCDHFMQAPGEIVKPLTSNHARRGRPRLPPNQNSQRSMDPPVPARVLDEPTKVLVELSDFLRQIPKVDVDLKLFYENTPLYHLYRQRMATDSTYVDIYGSSFGLPAERALSEFLYGMSTSVEEPAFIPELITLMSFLLDMLHSSGASENAIHISSLRLIEVANEFVLQFQDRYIPRLKSFGQVPSFFELLNVIRVVEQVFMWLYKKRYSNSWVKINQTFVDYNK